MFGRPGGRQIRESGLYYRIGMRNSLERIWTACDTLNDLINAIDEELR
ncbi:hypothetical protein A4R44_01974 [Amycolatopsis sp. M39]|nr:hypothetical protein A4R44_01974 [Amycolatopsis sp. M39]